jgi:hypothetical protein
LGGILGNIYSANYDDSSDIEEASSWAMKIEL